MTRLWLQTVNTPTHFPEDGFWPTGGTEPPIHKHSLGVRGSSVLDDKQPIHAKPRFHQLTVEFRIVRYPSGIVGKQ